MLTSAKDTSVVIEQDSIRNSIREEPVSGTGIGAESPGTESPVSDIPSSTMLRYLLTVFAVMAVMYTAPLILVRSGAYDAVNPSVFARPLNYAFATGVENADVVLFGDSTALLGIDPSQMSSDLGVKVVNLVNTQPSLVVNDDLTLRRYLGSNRPPKVIVFYFAPWDFDYGHTDFHARPTYEGEELLLRQGTWSELTAFLRKHPDEGGIFPLKFYATALEMTLHRVSHRNQNGQLAATHGHIDNMDAAVLSAPCRFTPLLLENIRFDWVRSLGEKYASPQTRILFYVAPVPACANVSSVLDRGYRELPAAPPMQEPPGFFSNDVRYVHPLPFAVPQITQNLTDAVRPMLAASEAQVQTSPANQDKRVP